MFSNRKKLLLGGAFLLAVLLIAGGYYGSRWLFSPDVESVTEYVLPDEPLPAQMNRPVRASSSQDTSSVPETDLVSESEDELFSDSETDSDSTSIDEELEATTSVAALSDEELTALAEALEQEEEKTSKYPAVPDGYPSSLEPVWLKDYFSEGNFSNHVVMDRVLIELWKQGDHSFVSASYDHNNGKIYPIYPDVIYIRLGKSVYDGPDGETIEIPYINSTLGDFETIEPLTDADGHLFTLEEVESGLIKRSIPV